MELPDAATAQALKEAIHSLVEVMVAQSKRVPPNVRQTMQPTIDVLQAAEFTPKENRLQLALQLPSGGLESVLERLAMMQLAAGPTSGAAGGGMGMPRAMMGAPTGAPAAVPGQPGASRPLVTRGSKGRAPSANSAMPPLPQLPSFQLTPPPVLRGDGVSTLPTANPSPPPAATAAPPPGGG
jgi:hypothetical protein